jgi:hypothetical protein
MATGAGETKLFVRRGNIEIKLEVNFVLRETVRKVQLASLSNTAHLEQLPVVCWKLKNLEQLAKTSPKKFAEQADALKRLLA